MFRINRDLCSFSPTGRHFATAFQQELTIKDCKTLEDCQSHTFGNTIENVQWSQDGQLILCSNSKKGIVEVYSIRIPNWRCKFTEGSAGFEKVSWAPSNKEFILTSDLNVHISICNVNTMKINHIWGLKSSIHDNFTINGIGEKLAVILSADGKDSIEIYEIECWKSSRILVCDKLFGIDGVSWSPNGELLGIWCSTIGKSRLLIYSSVTDSHIGSVNCGNINLDRNTEIGQRLLIENERAIKGIDKVVWGPSGELMAIAGYNETVAIVNHVTWSVTLELYCGPVVSDDNILNKVFQEVDIKRRNWSNDAFFSSIPDHPLRYELNEVYERPISLKIDSRPHNGEITIAAIDILEFSSCGKFLAIKHQLYPTTMFVWDLLEDTIDYLLSKNPISGSRWEPGAPHLLVFSDSHVILEWRPNRKATCFESPRGMKVLNAKWNPTGETLALHGYNRTSIIRINE